MNQEIHLTADESAAYEDRGPLGDATRRDVRKRALELSNECGGALVAVFSHDWIVFEVVQGETV